MFGDTVPAAIFEEVSWSQKPRKKYQRLLDQSDGSHGRPEISFDPADQSVTVFQLLARDQRPERADDRRRAVRTMLEGFLQRDEPFEPDSTSGRKLYALFVPNNRELKQPLSNFLQEGLNGSAPRRFFCRALEIILHSANGWLLAELIRHYDPTPEEFRKTLVFEDDGRSARRFMGVFNSAYKPLGMVGALRVGSPTLRAVAQSRTYRALLRIRDWSDEDLAFILRSVLPADGECSFDVQNLCPFLYALSETHAHGRPRRDVPFDSLDKTLDLIEGLQKRCDESLNWKPPGAVNQEALESALSGLVPGNDSLRKHLTKVGATEPLRWWYDRYESPGAHDFYRTAQCTLRDSTTFELLHERYDHSPEQRARAVRHILKKVCSSVDKLLPGKRGYHRALGLLLEEGVDDRALDPGLYDALVRKATVYGIPDELANDLSEMLQKHGLHRRVDRDDALECFHRMLENEYPGAELLKPTGHRPSMDQAHQAYKRGGKLWSSFKSLLNTRMINGLKTRADAQKIVV